jgi:RNA polymerase subunit RPABC4/transcription elongation factor Spt4
LRDSFNPKKIDWGGIVEILFVIFFFFFFVFLCVVAGVIARNKGESFFAYFFISFALTPLVGIIAALVISKDVARSQYEAIESGQLKQCPFCAEIIKSEARACRYCGRDVSYTLIAVQHQQQEIVAKNKKGLRRAEQIIVGGAIIIVLFVIVVALIVWRLPVR